MYYYNANGSRYSYLLPLIFNSIKINMKKIMYILLFWCFVILSWCTQNDTIQNNISKNNITHDKQKHLDDINSTSLWNIWDDEFAKLIWFKNTFWTTFKKNWDLESAFSCINNRCIKQKIDFNNLWIYLIISVKTWKSNQNLISKLWNNSFVINWWKRNIYELSKYNIIDFSRFLKTGECLKEYKPTVFSKHWEFLQKWDSKFWQNTWLYYIDILKSPYSGKVFMWYPIFWESINNTLLHKKGFVYIKWINSDNWDIQQCIISKEINNSIIFSINPKSFYEIKGINNTAAPVFDGLFSSPLLVDIIK